MSWVTFTSADVKGRLSDDEAELYVEAAGESQDRLEAIVTQTLARFRGAIRSNPAVVSMGAAGTLPDFCVFDAAVLARTALVGLSSVPEGVTDPRTAEYTAARKFLDSLSSMKAEAFGDDPTLDATAETASYGGADLLDF